MDNAFRHIHMPSELTCEFLAVFARMEYALKATRFAVGNGEGVSTNWDKFAIEADEYFHAEASAELRDAVEYLWIARPASRFSLRAAESSFLIL